MKNNSSLFLASMAHLDVLLTGDQEVVGSTPPGSATFFHGDLIMKYFMVILSRWLIQEGQLFLAKECAIILVYHLEE